MTFRLLGLDPAPFLPFYDLPDAELAARGIQRRRADVSPGFPDRVELRDATPGETLLLLNYAHQPAPTPYQASHAIFVREGAVRRYDEVGQVPPALRIRPISLRAFDAAHLMVDADLVDGTRLEAAIGRLLRGPGVAYLQAHYARPGCYAARIEPA
ncbi:MAG: DUF1203 domain-containing protein [Proteobacteria bacterium]|nr:DUF1203 domain-containing protein [Pseudomonadota bacterium]